MRERYPKPLKELIMKEGTEMNYQTRHYLRDSKLPECRNELLNKIVHFFKEMTGVQGIFLGGSIAKGNEDLFSDIDLRVVVDEECYNDFVKSKQSLAAQFGDVLFFEDMNPKAPFTIAHFSNFVKVDLFIYSFTTIHPSIWLQGIKIIFDETGKLHDLMEQSKKIVYQVSKEEVERWRGKAFSYIHEVYRRVLRNEMYYALTMINNLRSFIVNGWNMEAGRHSNDAWDWSKIEGDRSDLESWQLCLLSGWMCGRDAEDIMKTLHSMIPEFRRLHFVLCEKTGIDCDQDRFDRIVNMVL